MVCTNDKYTYSNIHALFMSSPHCFHKVNIFSNIIVLNPSTTFQIYDFISCETSCNCSHVPLHYPRKRKRKKKKIENQIKENKENKNKIKIKY